MIWLSGIFTFLFAGGVVFSLSDIIFAEWGDRDHAFVILIMQSFGFVFSCFHFMRHLGLLPLGAA